MKLTKAILIAIITLMMTAQVAQAKGFRSGGFRSKGMSRSHYSHNTDNPHSYNKRFKHSMPINNTQSQKSNVSPQIIKHSQPTIPNNNPKAGMMVPLTVAGALMAIKGNSSANNNVTETVVYQNKCADKEKAKQIKECKKN